MMKDLIKLQQDSKTDENILTLLIRRACRADYEDSCIFMRTASGLPRNEASRPRGCKRLPPWPRSLFFTTVASDGTFGFFCVESRRFARLHFLPPTFLLIRIRYLPATSAALPEETAVVLNGPCREGSAVKAREPLHDRGRAAGQGALSAVGGVVGAAWECKRKIQIAIVCLEWGTFACRFNPGVKCWFQKEIKTFQLGLLELMNKPRRKLTKSQSDRLTDQSSFGTCTRSLGCAHFFLVFLPCAVMRCS